MTKEAEMYRKNNLDRNVLIMTDEVVRKSAVDHSIDHRLLETSIEVAELRYIVHAIGREMYEDICSEKNKTVNEDNIDDLQSKVGSGVLLNVGDIVNASEFLPPHYLDLWKKHLWKVTAECVYLSSIVTNYSRFTSQGMMHNNPAILGLEAPQGQRAETISLKDAKWHVDKTYYDRVAPLISAMQDYICSRKASFGLYGHIDKCACDESGITVSKKKTPLIQGMYDDEGGDCGCKKEWHW